MTAFKAVILAAGLGTRMKSQLPKVMHAVLGRPMIAYPVDVALASGAVEVAVVVGHGRDLVEDYLRGRYGDVVSTHVQHQMLGTADAVRSGSPAFDTFEGAVIILSGDVPNLTADTVAQLIDVHAHGRSPVTLLTAHDPTPNAYGRIDRDSAGAVTQIVEFKDADERQRAITEVNIGTYVVDAAFLRDGLGRIGTDNAAGEFYLTDLIAMAAAAGRPAQTVVAEDIVALHGVNDRAHLADAQHYARRRRNTALMRSGVTMLDPATTTIEADVVVGNDAVLEPCVYLLGETHVGSGARVGAHSRLESCTVAAGAAVPPGTCAVGAAFG